MALALLTLVTPAPAQTVDWVREFGAYPRAVSVDDQGNVYTLGSFEGTVDFDPGPGIFELTSEGSSANRFILKLNHDGNFVWAGALDVDSASLSETTLFPDGSGALYLSGYFRGTGDFDPGPGRPEVTCAPLTQYGSNCWFVLKLDEDERPVWVRASGGPGSARFWQLTTAVGPDGDVYTVGYFQGTVDFDPGPDTALRTSADWSSLFDPFLLKLDAAGNFAWVHQLGNPSLPNHFSPRVVVDQSGSVYTLTEYKADQDYFLLRKWDSAGHVVWDHRTPGIRESGRLAVDSEGNVYYSIREPGVITPQPLRKLLPDGTVLQEVRLTLQFPEFSLDDEGNLWVVGRFSGTKDFDPGAETFELTSYASADLSVTKLDADLRFLWARQIGGWSSFSPISSAGGRYVVGHRSKASDCPPGPRTAPPPLFTAGTGFVLKLGEDCADGKVSFCHAPLGNPDNAHTICVGSNAVPAHLGHGDDVGPCIEENPEPDAYNLDFTDPGEDYVLPEGPCPCFTESELMADAMELQALFVDAGSAAAACHLVNTDIDFFGLSYRVESSLYVNCSYPDNRLCDYRLRGAAGGDGPDLFENLSSSGCTYKQGPGSLCNSGQGAQQYDSQELVGLNGEQIEACRTLIKDLGETLGCEVHDTSFPEVGAPQRPLTVVPPGGNSTLSLAPQQEANEQTPLAGANDVRREHAVRKMKRSRREKAREPRPR